jgi:hypothetical protein
VNRMSLPLRGKVLHRIRGREMLAYFPKPYPGEILYSVLARLWMHIGQPKPRAFMELILGRKNASATFDFPGHLDQLVQRVPFDALQTDRVIDELTLFPYYTAFEPPDMRAALRKGMKTGRLNTTRARSGLQAYAVGRTGELRYCPGCSAQMYEAYGEMYWRREHQIPGVLVCPVHHQSLCTCSIARSSSCYLPASPDVCPGEAPAIVPSSHWDVMPHLERLALLSRRVLEMPPPARTLKGWQAHYVQLLRSTDLSLSKWMTDQQLLNAQLCHFYGRTLELLPNVMEGETLRGNWLTNMVRNDRRAVHPLYHLLLQDFLDQRDQHHSPFGAGPWRCGNKACTVGERFPVKSFTWHRLRNGTRMAVFSCACGYSFAKALDETTGEPGQAIFLMFHAPVTKELEPPLCT